MSYEYLVCPECGSSRFDQRRHVAVNVTVQVPRGGSDLEDVAECVLERGERDESVIACEDCGTEYQHDTDELLTQEQYDERVCE